MNHSIVSGNGTQANNGTAYYLYGDSSGRNREVNDDDDDDSDDSDDGRAPNVKKAEKAKWTPDEVSTAILSQIN